MGVLILVVIAVLSASIWHALVPSYVVASLAAMVSSAVVFQGAAFLELGYLDPFFPVAVVTSSVLALAIALLIGWPFLARRKRLATRPS